jgi:hypothetical protein
MDKIQNTGNKILKFVRQQNDNRISHFKILDYVSKTPASRNNCNGNIKKRIKIKNILMSSFFKLQNFIISYIPYTIEQTCG